MKKPNPADPHYGSKTLDYYTNRTDPVPAVPPREIALCGQPKRSPNENDELLSVLSRLCDACDVANNAWDQNDAWINFESARREAELVLKKYGWWK